MDGVYRYAATWGYSLDGGYSYSTGYPSRAAALRGAVDECWYVAPRGIVTAQCRPMPLYYEVSDRDLEEAFEAGEDAAQWLVEAFLRRNDEADFEGERFRAAEVDDTLRAELSTQITAEEATVALARWIERCGGLKDLAALEVWDRQVTPICDLALLTYRPGVRVYADDFTLRDDGIMARPWQGVAGLADMPHYAVTAHSYVDAYMGRG